MWEKECVREIEGEGDTERQRQRQRKKIILDRRKSMIYDTCMYVNFKCQFG